MSPVPQEASAPSPLRARPDPAPVPGWAFGLIFVLAVIPRLFQAFHTALQFDEIQALLLARRNFGDMLAAVNQAVDPPLHFIILWAWRAVGGEGTLWLKTLPILCGLATVLLLLPLGRALFSARAGVLAAALLAVNGAHIVSSQYIRAYAFSWLLLMLTVWFAWRWTMRSSRADAAGLVACSIAALYTDYFSAFVLLALGLWGLLRVRTEKKRLLAWIGLWLVIALAFAPHLPAMIAQLGQDVANVRWVQPLAFPDLLLLSRSLAFGSVWLIPLLAVVAALPLQRPAQWKAASLLWFLILLPTLVSWEMSNQGMHLFLARQMLCTLPLWCLLVGAGLAHMRKLRLAFFLGVLLVAIAGLTWLAQWKFITT